MIIVKNAVLLTDMLKLVMKAILGNSISKKISWDEFSLFSALEDMTVCAKRDDTVQVIRMLCTSTFWINGKCNVLTEKDY